MNPELRIEKTQSRRGWARTSVTAVVGLVVACAAVAVPVTGAQAAWSMPVACAAPGSVSATLGSAAGSYIVRAHPGGLDAVAAVVAGCGGRLGRRIAIIDAVVAQLPAGAADALRADPRVASVTANAAVQMMSTTYVPGQDVNSLYSLGNMVGTRGWWNKYTGAGVDVALVDTGVSPVVGLADPGKIVNGPDLTPESQNPDTSLILS